MSRPSRRVHLFVPSEDFERWKRAAGYESLSSWLRRQCNAACPPSEPEPATGQPNAPDGGAR
jgi:hypothetical protein